MRHLRFHLRFHMPFAAGKFPENREFNRESLKRRADVSAPFLERLWTACDAIAALREA